MEETAQQHTQRILGYLEGRKPMEVLAATPGQIARMIRLSLSKPSASPAQGRCAC
jgi:hypothetical protein